jgi:membrane protein implicated in regulation of membrane protease activity
MTFNIRRAALLAIGASAAALAAAPAFAYVGPGAGLTLLGALWGLIVAVVLSVGFILLWPLRRFMRRNKQVCATNDRHAVDDDPTHSMLTNPSDRDERRM